MGLKLRERLLDRVPLLMCQVSGKIYCIITVAFIETKTSKNDCEIKIIKINHD